MAASGEPEMIVEEDLLGELNRIAKKGLRGPARKTAAEAAFHIRTLRLSLEAQERSRIDLIAQNRSLAEEIVKLRAILDLEPDTWTGPPWRPVTTAPTDGTEILVYAPPYDGPPGCPALPPIICNCAHHPEGGWCIDELRQVTHWMPSPPAPPEAK